MSVDGKGVATETEVRDAAVRQAVEEQRVVVVRRRVHRPATRPMSDGAGWLLGMLMLLLPLLLIAQIIAVWPSALAATTPRGQPTTVWLFGVKHMTMSPDGALIMLVVLVGALTSLAEASFRFVANAGRGELSRRWTWSYLMRPVQGAVLALTSYFALRAGLLGTSSASDLNPFGIAAIAALVGLFTRQAYQKLKVVFNGLWGVDDLDADIQPDPAKDPPEGQSGNGAASMLAKAGEVVRPAPMSSAPRRKPRRPRALKVQPQDEAVPPADGSPPGPEEPGGRPQD